MNAITNKLGVGAAACAVAVGLSMASVAPAVAVPQLVPAAPVQVLNVPLAPKLLGGIDILGQLNNKGTPTASTFFPGWYPGYYFTKIKAFIALICYRHTR